MQRPQPVPLSDGVIGQPRQVEGVEVDRRNLGGQRHPIRGGGENDDRTGSGRDVRDPLGRLVRVYRDVRTAGLDHGIDSHQQIHRPSHRYTHERFGAHAAVDQEPRQLIRASVELCVRRHGPLEHDGWGVGRVSHLRVEQLGESESRHVVLRRIPRVDHQLPFLRNKNVDVADRCVRVARDGLENPDHARRECRDGIAIENSAPVTQAQPQSGFEDRQQCDRVVRGVTRIESGHSHSRDVGVLVESGLVDGVRLEHRQRVEQVAQTHARLDVAESEVMVIEQGNLLTLEACEQLRTRLVRVHPHPHGHGVDEKPQHALDTGQLRRTTRHGGTEHHVATGEQPGQQYSPRRLDHGVHGDSVARHHRVERIDEGRG
ncbi:hypothetical protein MLGJGCBP_03101 [Rhodococcus sp. T7]|nr:hypothetical protein MLGJGCBP_03101 [Rhodococcus sp. T7]